MAAERSGAKTLLLSVLMSAPGPLEIGLGLMTGRSSTQLADFFRRSAELLAIICSFAVYQLTQKEEESTARRVKLEKGSNIFVGTAMCIGGVIMICIALFAQSEDKGNVLPGLIIALLGVVANTLFFLKYTKLNKVEANAILSVQSRLYRAKALVDGCVVVALLAVMLFPASPVAGLLDTAGSVIVAGYLAFCGVKTIVESVKKSVSDC